MKKILPILIAVLLLVSAPHSYAVQGDTEEEKQVYEVDPMVCPKCGGQMKVVAFITEVAVVDRIIDHLNLKFVAAKPPQSHVFEQVALVAAEESGEYC